MCTKVKANILQSFWQDVVTFDKVFELYITIESEVPLIFLRKVQVSNYKEQTFIVDINKGKAFDTLQETVFFIIEKI